MIKNLTPRFVVASCALLVSLSSAALGDLMPARLRCEHRSAPMEVGDPTPELSWIVESNTPGARQTKYHVLVARSPESLDAGIGDLWDSGEVQSDQTTGIRYAGSTLRSSDRCYWKVRVWDENGSVSDWSDPAGWGMGMLDQADWSAEWIGHDAQRDRTLRRAPLDGAKWIIATEGDPQMLPAGHQMYVLPITLPQGDPVVEATVLAAADNKFWLAVNGKMIVHGEPGWEIVKPVSIAETLQEGENDIRFNVQNEEQGLAGLVAKIRIKLASGKVMDLASSEEWQRYDEPAHHWPSQPLDPAKLHACIEVGSYGVEPWGTAKLQDLFLPPVPLLRGEVPIDRPVAQATLYASALGLCDAYINGERVSEDRFTPGWSDYKKRVYCRAYDVTGRLQQGANALGAVLSDGWYAGYVGWGRNRDHYGESPRVRLQLEVRYEDGSTQRFGTDSTWRATAGPTSEADFLMGESYDARRAVEGWASPGFDDADWAPVDTGSTGNFIVEPHPGPPVVAVREFEPISISEPQPGVHVFDLGQYIAGVVRLEVNGEPGQEVRLRFAERLNPDGTLYTANLRGARTTDTFTCSGGEEVWEPRFTFHGFQYVEVTGLSSVPTTDTITGIALSSDTPRAGTFDCSDPMLNRLAKNIYWTQSANFIDVPTDCPQRDERLGWTGDAQVYVATACLNADVQAFFDKWLVDLTDGQRDDGQFPMVAPLIVAGDDGGPAWADAGVICPWQIYEMYGDEQMLRRQYPSMKRFVDFCRTRSHDEVLPPEEFHCFGDWLSVNADTPHEVIYTAYYARCTRLLSLAATALGKAEEAEEYQSLADRIDQAFRDEFVQADGRIKGDTQCCYVLALAYDLLNDEQREEAGRRLVADIESRDNHLSTGFVGTKDLMLALAKIDRNDVALRLLHQTTYPSWGFSISHGATSIWERWDGWTPDGGFQDPGMNSFAHYSFGAVYQWMVENLGGIRNGGEVYRRVTIQPTFDDTLTHVRVTYDSVRGEIVSHWRREPGGIRLDVTIPPNCTGEVRLAAVSADDIKIDGKAIANAKADTDRVVVPLPSGSFSFFVATE